MKDLLIKLQNSRKTTWKTEGKTCFNLKLHVFITPLKCSHAEPNRKKKIYKFKV